MFDINPNPRNIINPQDYKNDKYYKLKQIQHKIELETWKNLNYVDSVSSTVEFYYNTVKQLQELLKTYNYTEVRVDGFDDTISHYQGPEEAFAYWVNYLIGVCSRIINNYRTLNYQHESLLNDVKYENDYSEELNNLSRE